jgi:hypothetical protein
MLFWEQARPRPIKKEENMKKILAMISVIILLGTSAAFAGCGACGAGAHNSAEAEQVKGEEGGTAKAAEADYYGTKEAGNMQEGKAVQGTNLSTTKAEEAMGY